MGERKDIDRLFQEKFKDFEKSPGPEMWARIEQKLNKDKKKRRVIPIWWQLGGVAALLLLFLSIGFNWFGSSVEGPAISVETPEQSEIDNSSVPDAKEQIKHQNENAVADIETDQNKIQHARSERSRSPENSRTDLDPKDTSKEKEQNGPLKHNTAKQTTSDALEYGIASAETPEHTTEKKSNPIESAGSEVIYQGVQQAGINTTDYYQIYANTKTIENTFEKEKLNQSQTIEEAIAAAEALKEEVPVKEGPVQRWSVTPVVAPVYSMALGEGSTIHSQFNQNAKSSDLTMSYGVGGSYTVSKRLKVRAGVNRVDFSNTTKDVLAFAAIDVASRPQLPGMGNITMRADTNVLLMSASILNRSSSSEVLNTQPVGQLVQDYGFLEVPLALEYRLVDSRFGINLVGGFSTFFLNNNEISAEFNGESAVIGQANNINSTSYSANFGVGLDYGISKQINVVLEPMFKYQINTFNNTFGDVQPFFIGVYTGLNFKF